MLEQHEADLGYSVFGEQFGQSVCETCGVEVGEVEELGERICILKDESVHVGEVADLTQFHPLAFSPSLSAWVDWDGHEAMLDQTDHDLGDFALIGRSRRVDKGGFVESNASFGTANRGLNFGLGMRLVSFRHRAFREKDGINAGDNLFAGSAHMANWGMYFVLRIRFVFFGCRVHRRWVGINDGGVFCHVFGDVDRGRDCRRDGGRGRGREEGEEVEVRRRLSMIPPSMGPIC